MSRKKKGPRRVNGKVVRRTDLAISYEDGSIDIEKLGYQYFTNRQRMYSKSATLNMLGINSGKWYCIKKKAREGGEVERLFVKEIEKQEQALRDEYIVERYINSAEGNAVAMDKIVGKLFPSTIREVNQEALEHNVRREISEIISQVVRAFGEQLQARPNDHPVDILVGLFSAEQEKRDMITA